ncbi:twin-arginine translocase subunit TatC [uncultured Kocuria sp.]|uniref:twin-arginine translocase subunit TatC n=1 Tax=uncultured Kocuria sp. TaxID=259305 RepID=UPI002632F719|nr:twin-arginine translocase subunit TatC [uncultured Kocuria sp.]
MPTQPRPPKKAKVARKNNPQAQMALAEHLREFRNRLIKAIIATAVGTILGFFIYEPFITQLKAPVDRLNLESGREAIINFSGVASSFNVMVEVSIALGLIVSSPVWLYQLWAFVTPALHRRERRYAIGFIVTAVPLFLAGIGVAILALPAAIYGLTAFTPEGSSNIITASDYIRFVLQLVLTFGIAFVVPVLLVMLNMIGVLSGRTVLKSWRIVVVLVLIVSAMAAPGPDPLTMFYLAIPLIALFFVAITICLLLDRRRSKKQRQSEVSIGSSADKATSMDTLKDMGYEQ